MESNDLQPDLFHQLEKESIGYHTVALFLSFIGFSGNLLTILSVIRFEHLQTPPNVLILNLAGK